MSADRLFDVPEAQYPPREELSAGQRLTIRNRRLLDAGVHPATRRPLLDGAGTCGDCVHHVDVYGHNARHYHKCDVSKLGLSSSAASDIRVSWPGCVLFERES